MGGVALFSPADSEILILSDSLWTEGFFFPFFFFPRLKSNCDHIKPGESIKIHVCKCGRNKIRLRRSTKQDVEEIK